MSSNQPTPFTPPTPPCAPSGAALPRPTAAPLEPRPVQECLDRCYPLSLVAGESKAIQHQESWPWRPAPWHRPLQEWMREAFGDATEAA